MGQIIKVLSKAKGNPAISASGEPLPGDWYRVLTDDGTIGYCFSYRLDLFEHTRGPLGLVPAASNAEEDPDLEMVLSKTWYPESYGSMVNARHIDLADLSKKWQFSPGQDTGIAHIYLPTLDKTFPYTGIRGAGNRSWRFEGAPLQMSLRSDTTLAVQYSEDGGAQRTALFVSLPIDIGDLIIQETDRRQDLFQNLYTQGPAFNSTNYGTLSFIEDGKFTWSGYNLLVPQIIPSSALGSGTVSMDVFLAPALQEWYDGTFSLRFDVAGGGSARVIFIYIMDTQGLRIEYVPMDNLDGLIVPRRSMSPMVLYFFRKEPLQPNPDSGLSPDSGYGTYDYNYDTNADTNSYFYPDLNLDADLYPNYDTGNEPYQSYPGYDSRTSDERQSPAEPPLGGEPEAPPYPPDYNGEAEPFIGY
jgi:hypothetical protein